MKLLEHPMRSLVKVVLVFGFVPVLGITPLVTTAQIYTGTLADLANNGGTLSIDDKIFSDFSYQDTGLTSFNASNIIVTASQSGGIDYLTWTGNISFVSGGIASADLLLNYIVTASAGEIDLIDQSYTGSAQNGLLAVDETAAIGNFGGTVVGYSHLEVGDYSDPPSEAFDNLAIVPPQSVLYVTKDIGLAVTSTNGGFITISQVTQSFHQIPEPSTAVLGGLGGGWLLFLKLRRQAKRN